MVKPGHAYFNMLLCECHKLVVSGNLGLFKNNDKETKKSPSKETTIDWHQIFHLSIKQDNDSVVEYSLLRDNDILLDDDAMKDAGNKDEDDATSDSAPQSQWILSQLTNHTAHL